MADWRRPAQADETWFFLFCGSVAIASGPFFVYNKKEEVYKSAGGKKNAHRRTGIHFAFFYPLCQR